MAEERLRLSRIHNSAHEVELQYPLVLKGEAGRPALLYRLQRPCREAQTDIVFVLWVFAFPTDVDRHRQAGIGNGCERLKLRVADRRAAIAAFRFIGG